MTYVDPVPEGSTEVRDLVARFFFATVTRTQLSPWEKRLHDYHLEQAKIRNRIRRSA